MVVDNGSDKVVVSSKSKEISIATRIGEIIMVPTNNENKPKKTVDLRHITTLDDLKSIKKQDSFMYYSIPGARKATVRMQDIDMANLLGAPEHAVQDEAPQISQKVLRSTRVSFECHPDLLLADLLNDLEGLDLENLGEEDLLDMDFEPTCTAKPSNSSCQNTKKC